MRAMILAAGLGTRLRPLTDERPKALVEINGHTLLEITLARLRNFGIRDVIVNAHHLGGMVIDYLKVNANFGMNIEVSQEDVLLDTGGGLKKAAHFFLQDDSEEPFLVHNVDVLSTIDFDRMLQFHTQQKPLATLAVQKRESSRLLLFDEQLQLCGRRSKDIPADEIVRACSQPTAMAFTGIHIVSPRIVSLLSEDGIFPIVPVYLRLASLGERILAFQADDYYWRDLGTAAGLQQAAQDASSIPLLGSQT
jgi:NDP-sugar pyrophosphorylase family protein